MSILARESLISKYILLVFNRQVKRKEPQELEERDMKRPRPSTPPDEDEGLQSWSWSFRNERWIQSFAHALSSCLQQLRGGCQKQRDIEQKGTTRGGKRSRGVVNLGSSAAKERKRLTGPPLKRCLFGFSA